MGTITKKKAGIGPSLFSHAFFSFSFLAPLLESFSFLSDHRQFFIIMGRGQRREADSSLRTNNTTVSWSAATLRLQWVSDIAFRHPQRSPPVSARGGRTPP